MMKIRFVLVPFIMGTLILGGCSAEEAETKIDFGQYAPYIEKNDMVKISLIDMSSSAYSDGSSDTEFRRRIETTIDLKTKEETTIDYTDCYLDDGTYDEGRKKEIAFEKVFQFQIDEQEKAEDIINEFLAEEGYNEDLQDSERDSELSEANNLDAYVFQQHCNAEDNLRARHPYDEIVRKETYFIENEEGVPMNFCAVFQYKAGENLFTESSLLRIEFFINEDQSAAEKEQ